MPEENQRTQEEAGSPASNGPVEALTAAESKEAPDTPLPPPAPPRPGASSPKRRIQLHRGPLTKEGQDRIAILTVRTIFVFASAGLGLAGARLLAEITGRPDMDDPFLGILAGCGLGIGLIGIEMLFSRSPIRTLSALTFGLLMGLALSLVFQNVVEFIVTSVTSWEDRLNLSRQQSLIEFLKILTTTLFCYFGVTVLLRTKDDFKFIIPYVEFRKDLRGQAPLVFDTSVFVDGRIQGILATGVFDQRFVVPKFVLAELQTIADSQDRSLRERGRRGMDILHEVERTHHVEILDLDSVPRQGVDEALIGAAAQLGAKIVTTDFNLQKNARLQGIQVLNVNDLATALKPVFVPGETMSVRLLREGEDRGQAVGFLKDGTMVVVENARNKIGQEALVEVTSALQTNAGKMLFAKLRRQGKGQNEP